MTYEAVRNYHFDRDPPVAYLVRVAEVFDISLEWLATGEGPMVAPSEIEEYVVQALGASGEDAAAHARRIYKAFHEGAGATKDAPLGLPLHRGSTGITLLGGLLHRRRHARLQAGEEVTPEVEVEMAFQLGRAVVAPLDALGVERNYHFLAEHIEAMAPVIFRALAFDDPPVRDAASIRLPRVDTTDTEDTDE